MLSNNNSIIIFFLRPETEALKYRINTADPFSIDVPVYAELSGKDFFPLRNVSQYFNILPIYLI